MSSEASGTAWVMSEDQRVELIDATESDPSWNRRPVRKRLGAPYIRFSARAAEGVAGDETLTHGLPTADCKRL